MASVKTRSSAVGSTHHRAIIQLDMDGNYVDRHPSVKKAALKCGLKEGTVGLLSRGRLKPTTHVFLHAVNYEKHLPRFYKGKEPGHLAASIYKDHRLMGGNVKPKVKQYLDAEDREAYLAEVAPGYTPKNDMRHFYNPEPSMPSQCVGRVY